MHASRTRTLLALPLLLTTSAYAVSLHDFPPRASDLPSACNTIYQSTISGCSPSDFTSGNGCSSGCIAALQALTPEISDACSSTDAVSGTVLNAFLHNDGPAAICPNAASTAQSTAAQQQQTSSVLSSIATTTEAAATTSSVMSSAATTAALSSMTQDPTSSTEDSPSTSSSVAVGGTTTVAIVFGGTATASELSGPANTATTASQPALTVDTSSPPTDKAGQTAVPSQYDTNHSGGGSPFDTASSTNSGFRSTLGLSSLGAAALLVLSLSL